MGLQRFFIDVIVDVETPADGFENRSAMGISCSPVGTDGQMIVFVDIERDALGTLLQCQRLDVLQNFLPQSEALKLLLNINFFKVNLGRAVAK